MPIKHREQRVCRSRPSELRHKARITQPATDLCQRLQMIRARIWRREQAKGNVDWQAVYSLEINRMTKLGKDGHDMIKPIYFGMRNGDALAKAGRAQPLSLSQDRKSVV